MRFYYSDLLRKSSKNMWYCKFAVKIQRKSLDFDQNLKFSKSRAVSRTFEDLKTKTVLSELLQAPNNSISGPIVPGESRNAPIFLSLAPPISGFWSIFTAGNPIPLRFPYANINRAEYCSRAYRIVDSVQYVREQMGIWSKKSLQVIREQMGIRADGNISRKIM